MLGFLFRPRRERGRLLFTYDADGREKRADPIAVDAALEKAGGREWASDLETVADLHRPLSPFLQQALTPDELEQRRERFTAAVGKLVGLSRKVFGLPEIDPDTGRGVTGAEALAVLVAYVEWSRAVAEEVRPLA